MSIAKAGITTSLNARTSILAAANPQYGRYDPTKKPHENINLPAALLSRFDLIFLLLDKANTEKDIDLARHVTNVHRTMKAPAAADPAQQVSTDVMRAFLAHAQTFEPTIPAQLHQYIVAKYVEKRTYQRTGDDEKSYMYVTPRTLLAIIRISQAMAKLSFRNEVNQTDVDTGLSLMDYSIKSLKMNFGNPKSIRQERKRQDNDDEQTKIIYQVRQAYQSKSQGKYYAINDCLRQVRKNGGMDLDRETLMQNLEYYDKLDVININTELDEFIFL